MALSETETRQRRVPDGGTEGSPPTLQTQPSLLTCSICLEQPQHAVETNCGHLFCAQCILMHWNHDRYPRPCRCPMCRREVTLLLCSENLSTTNNELFSQVLAHNQQMQNSQGGLISRLRDLPVLFRHLYQDVFRVRGGLPVCSKLYFLMLALAVAVYVFSPLDLIPEFIFGIFGLLDDVIVIIYMLLYAVAIYRTYVTNQQN